MSEGDGEMSEGDGDMSERDGDMSERSNLTAAGPPAPAEAPAPLPGAESEAWKRVQLARHPQRPTFLEWAQALFADFHELHGDRRFGDDAAVVGGLANFRGREVMAIGQQKGRDIKEKVRRNFGMPQPEGFRKALRLMHLAEKFERPVLT
ncbi:MAG: hypothetical protein ACRD1E_08170, partial [Terriglobales bacterium]